MVWCWTDNMPFPEPMTCLNVWSKCFVNKNKSSSCFKSLWLYRKIYQLHMTGCMMKFVSHCFWYWGLTERVKILQEAFTFHMDFHYKMFWILIQSFHLQQQLWNINIIFNRFPVFWYILKFSWKLNGENLLGDPHPNWNNKSNSSKFGTYFTNNILHEIQIIQYKIILL